MRAKSWCAAVKTPAIAALGSSPGPAMDTAGRGQSLPRKTKTSNRTNIAMAGIDGGSLIQSATTGTARTAAIAALIK
jgi:hypothetical protein